MVRAVINKPFGRMACVTGAPIRVAADASDDTLESARQQVERGLNDATARAEALADGAGHG